jgi:predicted nuclease of restriction endonuclease-like (RecB) superfamily
MRHVGTDEVITDCDHLGTDECSEGYAAFLSDVKARIRAAQTSALLSANRELILLYWHVGRMISERQKALGWGAKVIDRLALDLKNELPEIKGFSARNMRRMRFFIEEYPRLDGVASRSQQREIADETFWPQPEAKLIGDQGNETKTRPQDAAEIVPQLAAQLAEASLTLPWMHNALLMEKVKDLDARLWYMRETVAHGWSREALQRQIKRRAHERRGRAVTNFDRSLPAPQSDLAAQTLKDPYIFDFLTLAEPFRERELESALVRHLQDFLVELGIGFAFVGRQVRLEVDGEEFYVDLLFYHLKLRCYVVVELKRGAFRPEYAGQLNFYLNVVDERLRHPDDGPAIGLILCQDERRVVAEYALRGLDKAIGVSEYELSRHVPEAAKGSLPEIEEIEAVLAADAKAEVCE